MVPHKYEQRLRAESAERGTERAVVPGADHEVYLTDPAVLAALIEAPTP